MGNRTLTYGEFYKLYQELKDTYRYGQLFNTLFIKQDDNSTSKLYYTEDEGEAIEIVMNLVESCHWNLSALQLTEYGESFMSMLKRRKED